MNFTHLLQLIKSFLTFVDVDEDAEDEEEEEEESEDIDSGEEDEKPVKVQYVTKGRKPLSPEKKLMRELYNFLMR
jgi:FtsZ-interacting cell division protein YlmF